MSNVPIGSRASKLFWVAAISLAVVALLAATTAAAAPKPPKPGPTPTPTPGPSGGDHQAPTTPTDLRVTGATAYSVSFAWNPSTDNSGSFVYRICCGDNSSATVPAPASSYTFVGGVRPNSTYSFRMFAQDAAGNVSNYSNFVTVTTPADVTPPTQPVVTVTDVGATHVSLAYSSIEEGPLWFTVTRDDTVIIHLSREASGTAYFLEPETTHTFRVQARDYSGKLSPVSDPIVATTTPRDTSDTTPPSKPPNFWGDVVDHSAGEVNMFWNPSTDDVTPELLIRYDIYLNGVFDHATTGGWERAVVYAVLGAVNTLEVYAVDEAGNRSVPVTLTVDLRF